MVLTGPIFLVFRFSHCYMNVCERYDYEVLHSIFETFGWKSADFGLIVGKRLEPLVSWNVLEKHKYEVLISFLVPYAKTLVDAFLSASFLCKDMESFFPSWFDRLYLKLFSLLLDYVRETCVWIFYFLFGSMFEVFSWSFSPAWLCDTYMIVEFLSPFHL